MAAPMDTSLRGAGVGSSPRYSQPEIFAIFSAMASTAFAREAKAVEAIAENIAKISGWEYLGLDPTPAPLKDVSIGAAIESYTGQPLGSSGTMTAAFAITN